MNRQELVQKLELVSRALADNNVIPIFQNFGFTGKTVFAYNDSLAIIAPDVKTKDAFAVDGKILLGLLKNSFSDDVNFKLENTDLTVETGKSVFTLPAFLKSDFLFKEPDEEPQTTVPMSPDFLEGLAACLLTSSRDEAHRAWMGVVVNQQFKNVTLYSSNGDAITSFITDAKSAVEGKNYLLSNEFCDAVLKAFKETEAKDGILDISEEWAKASLTSGYVIYGRLPVVDTPTDHDSEIRKTISGRPKFVKIPEGLNAALSRARVLADIESAATGLSIDNKGWEFETATPNGNITDILDSEGHNDVEALVSAELMQQCIGLCDEMVVLSNCSAFRKGERLFILTGNRGE